jgi:hypothetical protein
MVTGRKTGAFVRSSRTVLLLAAVLLFCCVHAQFTEAAKDGGQSAASVNLSPGEAKLDFGPYMKRLQRKVKESWRPPRNTRSFQTKAAWKVHRDGHISDLQIMVHGLTPAADEAALQAVRSAAPFEPLPEGAPPSVDTEFTFDYNAAPAGKGLPWLVPGGRDERANESAGGIRGEGEPIDWRNPANIEALLNICANLTEILGLVGGGPLLILCWIPSVSGVRGYSLNFLFLSLGMITIGLLTPGIINVLVEKLGPDSLLPAVAIGLVLVILMALASLFTFFIPAWLAVRRKKAARGWIILLNCLFFLPLSWLVAFIWACMADRKLTGETLPS